jgi:hypothetical protein
MAGIWRENLAAEKYGGSESVNGENENNNGAIEAAAKSVSGRSLRDEHSAASNWRQRMAKA